MKQSKSWFKVYRKILKWEWYDDINTRSLFLHILAVTNYEDKKWRGIPIKRGQFITSIRNLAKESGLTIQQTRTALSNLESTQDITRESTHQYTIITVNNYNMYQQPTQKATQSQHTANTQSTTTIQDIEDIENIESARKGVLTGGSGISVGKPSRLSYEKEYEAFKAEYSSVKNRGWVPARKWWADNVDSKEVASAILKGLVPHLEQWKALPLEEKRFVPDPVNWLKKETWKEEPIKYKGFTEQDQFRKIREQAI